MISARLSGASPVSGPIPSNAASARARTAGPVDREQARDVVVAAATLQHEIEDRALVGGERVERRHRDRLA